MSIKVCVIEPAGQEYGSELVLMDILRALDRNKFNLEVIIPKKCSFKRRLNQYNISELELLYINLYKGRNVWRPLSYTRIILHWIFNRPDLIIVNQAGILRGTALCNLAIRRPIICFVSTLEDADHLSKLPRWVYRKVHTLICNSEYTAKRIRNEPVTERAQVLYLGYYPKNLFSNRPPWNPGKENNRFVIGILGRICKSKGHDVLIKSLEILKEKGSEWLSRLDVVFIGDYQQQERGEMQALLAQSPINIEVTGYRENIAQELARLHLLLIPSVAEPFGRIVQEAADAGLPVIASDSGGLGEICRLFNYGRLFKYPDVASLTRLIEETIGDYDQVLVESLGKREKFLANFCFDKIMGIIEKNVLDACRQRQ